MFRWFRQKLMPATAKGGPKLTPLGVDLPPPDEAEIAILHSFLAAPDRAARREAVVVMLTDRLDLLLRPAGFARKASLWTKDLPRGQARVELRRLRGGINATVELTYVPGAGRGPKDRSMDALTKQLPMFFRPGEGTHFNHGLLHYAVLEHDPAAVDLPLRVMQDRALPWLLAHADGHFPDWQMFRDRP